MGNLFSKTKNKTDDETKTNFYRYIKIDGKIKIEELINVHFY